MIEQALPNDLRTRTHIVPVGSDSELIKQAVFHLRAGFGQHILLIWDGDVEKRNNAKKWLKDQMKQLKIQREERIVKSIQKRLNWGFLPGQEPPESWVIKSLNCAEGIGLLQAQLQCTQIEATGLLEELAALGNIHNIGFEVSKRMALSEIESSQLLVRSVSKLATDPLGRIREIVKSVLSHQIVRQKFKIA